MVNHQNISHTEDLTCQQNCKNNHLEEENSEELLSNQFRFPQIIVFTVNSALKMNEEVQDFFRNS